MSDFVDRKDCFLCSAVLSGELEAFRSSLESFPIKELVCLECEMSFWRNIGLPVAETVDDLFTVELETRH